MDETEQSPTNPLAPLDDVEDLEDLRLSPFAGLREQLEEPDPERPFSRRRVLQGLAVTVAGGVLGYFGYPWIVGGRRQETAHFLQRAWDELREPWDHERERWAHFNWNHGVEGMEEPVQPVPTVRRPLVLDANGVAYRTFLAGLELKHVQPEQLLRPHFHVIGGVHNEMPPPALWPNVVGALRVADKLQEQLRSPLISINSAYRCPAYNAACVGAAAQSYHMTNMALDLVFDCASEKVAKAAESLRASGVFSGGIGRYARFTHIDTRGRLADWG